MKIYCQNCGKPTEYIAMNKPNFCFNCGSSFGSGATSTASQVQQVVQLQLDDEEESSGGVPNINKLQVDIDVDKVQTTTMQDLMGTSQEGIKEPPRASSGLSAEELVRSTLAEGKALRGKQQTPKDDA